jgi:hypothetical protein
VGFGSFLTFLASAFFFAFFSTAFFSAAFFPALERVAVFQIQDSLDA